MVKRDLFYNLCRFVAEAFVEMMTGRMVRYEYNIGEYHVKVTVEMDNSSDDRVLWAVTDNAIQT